MRNLIKTFLVMLMLSFSHAALADEWDTFYDRYNGKVFVVSWQKKRNPDGTTIKPIYKETGFSMTSPDTVRTIGHKALQNHDTRMILATVFDRLYVLRNQIVHGGATWNSSVNRSQIRDGHEILAFLVPLFIDLMMDNPDKNWGAPYYPVIE